MSNSKILVTGATGLHGGVGGHTARLLREKGTDVRALVRSRDHRSEDLERLGIETVVGDFMNLQSLRRSRLADARPLWSVAQQRFEDGFGKRAATELRSVLVNIARGRSLTV